MRETPPSIEFDIDKSGLKGSIDVYELPYLHDWCRIRHQQPNVALHLHSTAPQVGVLILLTSARADSAISGGCGLDKFL